MSTCARIGPPPSEHDRVSADRDIAALVAAVEDERTEPDDVEAALTRLLAEDSRLGAATALGVLASAPRIKPSTGLLVDPGNRAMRRWRRRVAAARALLAAPAVAQVFAEFYDELTDSAEFAGDVLTDATVAASLTTPQRAAIARLGAPR
jgi:hypothetical protein